MRIVRIVGLLLLAAWAECADFARDIRPILDANCAKCHAGAAPQAGLDLGSLASALKGGKSGAAVVPGDPERSLMLKRIAAGQMPPGAKLGPEDTERIRRWILEGAPGRDAAHWAFVPPVRPPSATIDKLVTERLAAAGLRLNPEADRATLLRRVYFDLIGLPPSPTEVDQFLADQSPNAYDRMVERLLASEHHGERWGRHWLDVAGYADSEGVLAADVIRPNAWRYRDYVIRAINQDKPYDEFLREQLAGDEVSNYRAHDRLPADVVSKLEATGFLRTAVDATREDFQPKDFAEYQWRTYFDTQQIVTSSLLGLTMQCARCHDHKYEPITQKDYYRFLAFFSGALRPAGEVLPSAKRQIVEAPRAEQERAGTVNKPLDEVLKALRDLRTARLKQFRALHPKGDNATDTDLRKAFPEFGPIVDRVIHEIETEDTKRIVLPEIRALYDVDSKPAPTYVFLRGDPLKLGDEVQPGVPSLFGNEPTAIVPDENTSGRRTALANWLTRADHPLTARLMVNRIWAGHFGAGIVPTMDNFGKSGAAPTNQALLDWLATELVAQRWSVKAIHRQIVKSAVYKQASTARADGLRIDPENKLHWRFEPRRLEAETVRDAVLTVSGTLDHKLFGPPVMTTTRTSGEVVPIDDECHGRRSIYQVVRRSAPQSFLASFDSPVMEINCTRRVTSATPGQALAMMNSRFVASQAGHFANRVLREAPAGEAATFAFRAALGRLPNPRERDDLATFIRTQSARYPELTGVALDWRVQTDLCQSLLAANEFVYID